MLKQFAHIGKEVKMDGLRKTLLMEVYKIFYLFNIELTNYCFQN